MRPDFDIPGFLLVLIFLAMLATGLGLSKMVGYW